MDFISSISFLNEPLISGTFLGHSCHHFWVGATAKQQPKVMTKMVKKYSTDQRFIPKINTTYKIHTLVHMLKLSGSILNQITDPQLFSSVIRQEI